MQAPVLLFASPARLQVWLVAMLCFVLSARAASATTPLYSTSVSNYTSYVPVASPSGVEDASNAADAIRTNFATLRTFVGVASTTTLRMGLSGTGAGGDRAGVLVGNVSSYNNLLNLNTLGVIRLVTYNNSAVQETQTVSAAVAKALLEGDGRPTQLEFVAKLPFNAVELQVGGLATVSYQLRVYYAYAVPSLVQRQARGLVSRFSDSNLMPYVSTAIAPRNGTGVCANAVVANPDYAVDASLTNYAQFGSVASVNCPSSLTVKLEGATPAPAGFYAGFVIGSAGLLDLSVLADLRITTLLNDVVRETTIDPQLLEIKLLPGGQAQVSFPTTMSFNQVRIERGGLLSALDNLQLYYGFAVEPRALATTPPVLSNFPAGSPVQHQVTTTGVLCVGCGVSNPGYATDSQPATAATVNLTAGALASVNLKMNLNGTGAAGNRAGVKLGNGGTLLDLAALSQLTVSTYDAANNLLESASGASLLSVNVLADGSQEISFLTTQNFASVALTVAGGASAFNNVSVYHAFADDRTGVLPSVITPLPVELTAFTGRWTNGAAELNWATASEKNSRYFVVERSVGGEAAFRAVGHVPAAGNSTSPKAYQLRDAEASAQGAAVLYYRLRQVDADGTEAFSPLVAVAVGKAAPQLAVYPNPASGAQAVRIVCLNLPATGGTVFTYSEMGQLLSRLPLADASQPLVLPDLAPGLYHVVLSNAAGQPLATQRLVVAGK